MAALDSVRKKIQLAAEKAMYETEAKAYSAALNNLHSFYSQGNPKVYERTHQLGNSPRTTGIQGTPNHLYARIYLDMAYDYDTGTYATPHVFSEAEIGGSGILGKPHFWEKTEEEIEKAFNNAMSKRFR